LARIDRLDPAVKTALLAAAAGGRCPVAAAATVSARLPGGRTGALTDAEAAGLVRLSAGEVEFAHPLLRSVVYHSARPAERRAVHRALAEALGHTDPDRAAWQLAAAATGRDEVAADALDATASRAAGRGAPLVAAAAWERAAQLSGTDHTRAARYVAAAEAALRGGDVGRARRLASMSPAAQQPRWRVRMLAVKGRLDVAAGKMTAAQQAFQEAPMPIRGWRSSCLVSLFGQRWRPGWIRRPTGPPSSCPSSRSGPTKPHNSWPTWHVARWPGTAVIPSWAC
jgi:hypothetical protein